MAAPITKLRIGLKPDTPEEHTRLLINVNTEEAQTALQIATDLRVRANPATAKIYYYNYDGSELLYTETIEPGGNGSWDGEPGRASTAQYEFIFNGWSTEPDQVDPTEDATAGVYSARRVYAAYKRRDISGYITITPAQSTQKVTVRAPSGKKWDGRIFWSSDRATWTEWDGALISSEVDGGPIFVKGEGNSVVSGNNPNYGWRISQRAFVDGDIRVLLDSATAVRGEDPAMGEFALAYLFVSNSIERAPALPSKSLSNGCYAGMFRQCSALNIPPDLPATILAPHCYEYMFEGSGIVSAPSLPATTLAEACYSAMFSRCNQLTQPPSLLATEMATNCYSSMFANCISLAEPPDLPATELARGCYHSMFMGCAGIKRAPDLPATTLSISCYSSMFESCTGLLTLPELRALIITDSAYEKMFQGCTSIKLSAQEDSEYTEEFRIPAEGTGSMAYTAVYNMFANTGGTFTGEPVVNTTYYLAPPASA